MLGDLDDHYGPLGAADVIPNGRHARRFVPHEKEPLILAVGRLWDDAKNASMLARVANLLPWPIMMAGSVTSPEGGAIELSNRVRSLGHLAAGQLARWMARASIYALPARYEPFGLSVLEAALSGCALVLGDIPSLREIWGDAALFVSPDDDGALVHAITRLTRDRSLLQSLGRRARARALELSPQRMAVRYAAAYDRLRDGRAALEATACAS
jgi:glycosyltransferase involved in cell wall biosynthesis